MTKSTVTTDIGTAPGAPGEIEEATLEALIAESSEPEWMAERRRRAWEIYRETPIPTTKTEEWRYTDLTKIGWETLALRDPAPASPVGSLEELPEEIRAAFALEEPTAARSIQVNGVQVWSEVSPAAAAQGVRFLSLDDALREMPELLDQWFMTSVVPPDFGKLAALHGAFVSGGTVLYVPAGVEVALPITTYRWLDVEGVALFPHTLVVAGANSKVTYVEECAGPKRAQAGLAMNCGVAELIAEDGAQVRYAIVQQWGRHVFHYQACRVFAMKDARIQTLLVTLGAKIARSEVECDLQHEGGRSDMLGLYLADSNQHFDHYTYQLHAAPHASSDLLYKGALKDRSRAVFRGMIRVLKGAQGTDAYQTNRNLILSEDAHADSLPNLEIEADDVRCSHGATIGQQDEAQIFYLMSRGISRADAEKLIVSGFFEEVLARVDVEPLHRRLSRAVEEKLGV